MKSRKIIVALDSNNLNKTIKLVKILKKDVYAFKIGYQFFYHFGLDGYRKVYSICPKIFLDLKLHDIPNTVEKGLEALVKMKPLFTTIHISGGDDMMIASRKNKKNTKILGVSILTSLDSDQTKKYYNKKNVSALVKQFSRAAKKNKLDGVVCSPKEIKYIRKEIGRSFIIITPGIRINNKLRSDDQKRVETPKRALDQGANYLVIGRPITMSKDPLKTLREINNSLI
tara:strand:+ start:148 stop:831 length:684 start_codon:yes stop_codon:yes gene_type:complete